MKRLLLITAALITAAVTVYASDLVALRSINKIETGTQIIGRALQQSGPLTITSASVCTVFLNATTAARTKVIDGYPMIANTEYRYNLPQSTNLAFTCATSAAKKYVYIVR